MMLKFMLLYYLLIPSFGYYMLNNNEKEKDCIIFIPQTKNYNGKCLKLGNIKTCITEKYIDILNTCDNDNDPCTIYVQVLESKQGKCTKLLEGKNACQYEQYLDPLNHACEM